MISIVTSYVNFYKWDKKYSWELMCSNAVSLYKTLQEHQVNNQTFSTCHALGITHWGPDVVAPKGGRSRPVHRIGHPRFCDRPQRPARPGRGGKSVG